MQTLDGIEDGTLEAREQPDDGVSFAPKITVEDARVDWAEPALAVDRRVRACTPAPGAWTTFARRADQARPGAARRSASRLAPGRARGHQERRASSAPATGPVRLGEVKPFGKKQMAAADWARGARLEPGTRARRVASAMAARPRGRPEDVDEICGGLPETWFGTSWGDVPTWLVPLREQG